MAERRQPTRKMIMREFTINELSAVDRPAQEHARAVIMKRVGDDIVQKDVEAGYAPSAAARAIEALDFDAVVGDDAATREIAGIAEAMRSSWCALQRSFASIQDDASVPPADKITRMRESLGQYVDALAEKSAGVAARVVKSLAADPAVAGLLDPHQVGNSEGDLPMTDAEKRQLTELQDTVAALQKQLTAATDKEPAKKAADLQDALTKAQADVAALTDKLTKADAEKGEAVAKAGMSDAEKEHMAGLSGADKMTFMRMSPEDRKKAMAKAADEDPVVYKSADGQEFHKSDDPRLVAMAKRADESEKVAKVEREARETADLTKRADEFLKAFAGEAGIKVEVLREVAKMPEGPRIALEKMLEVGAKAIGAAFERIGHSREAVAKSGTDFEKRVAEIQARDKCSKVDAMTKARAEDKAAFDAYQGAEAN